MTEQPGGTDRQSPSSDAMELDTTDLEVLARYDQPPVVQPPVVQPPVVQTPSQPLTDEQRRAQRGSKFKKELDGARAQDESKRQEQQQYARRYAADKQQKPVTFSSVSSRKHYDGAEQDRDWIGIVDQSGRRLFEYIKWQLITSTNLSFKPPDSSDHLYKVIVTIPSRTMMSIVALVKSNEIFVIHAGPGSLF